MATVFTVGGSALAGDDAAVAQLKAGDALPSLALPDQHGTRATVGADTRLLLFSRDMDGGGFVKEALAEGGKDKLDAAGAVYIADVSGMPGFVRSTFALPSMRKRPYPILLDETGEHTRALPSQKGKATVMRIEGGRIADVTYASSTAEVIAALTAR
ncbi:MAG TPA: hypothetical protein VEC57_15245 [Candidatus Limnocylindrales bacterium]|nr:hypothetical protein [Candidatus Limnocylindrales bacterium]